MKISRVSAMEIIAKLFSVLFPPKLPVIRDLSHTADYMYRTTRTGVENIPGARTVPERVVLE